MTCKSGDIPVRETFTIHMCCLYPLRLLVVPCTCMSKRWQWFRKNNASAFREETQARDVLIWALLLNTCQTSEPTTCDWLGPVRLQPVAMNSFMQRKESRTAVMETSSKTRLNCSARFVRLLRISRLTTCRIQIRELKQNVQEASKPPWDYLPSFLHPRVESLNLYNWVQMLEVFIVQVASKARMGQSAANITFVWYACHNTSDCASASLQTGDFVKNCSENNTPLTQCASPKMRLQPDWGRFWHVLVHQGGARYDSTGW